MSARRTYGSGSLSQRSDGLWVGRVYSGWTPTGTRRRLQVTSKNKAEALRKLRDLQRRLATGSVPTVGTSGRTTVKAWSEVWLPIHATKVRPTTYTTDAGTLRKWIIPTLGHRRLTDLTPADMRALREAITKAGRSTTTALHSHTILVRMLKDAQIEGHAVPPRVLVVPKPKKASHDRDAIPVAQLLKVLAVVQHRPDAARWVAAILGGVRQGELLGMEWDRIDLDAATMDVSWQKQRLAADHSMPDGWEARPIVGVQWWTRPKTRAGKRSLPLVPWLVEALRREQAAWRPNPFGLVWTDDDGQPIKPETDRATWRQIQAAANVAHPSGRPWHVHECRHAAATILLRAGVSRDVIELILGQAALVAAYIHMDDTDARAAMAAAADVLGLTVAEPEQISPPATAHPAPSGAESDPSSPRRTPTPAGHSGAT